MKRQPKPLSLMTAEERQQIQQEWHRFRTVASARYGVRNNGVRKCM